MHQETTIIKAEDLFGDFSGPNAFRNTADGFEICWEWPGEIGNGYISMISLRPGIFIEIGNYRLREEIAISFEQTHHSVWFGFSASGSMRHSVDSEKSQQEYGGFFKQGHSNMGYLPKCRQNIAKPSVGIQTYSVLIAIDPLLLITFLDEQHDQIPIALRNIVNGAEEQHFYHTSIMSPAGNMAIQQIINCPYRSTLKRLFLEGKVLELISYSLAQVVSSADTLQKDVELRPDDIDRIMEARNILSRNHEDPPSLLALAKQVGTNKNKLNKGFRQIFGTSAFDYLRIRRLEQAKELLDNKKMNVGEAAAHVGYSHQSSFARAFKNHFGTTPTGHLY